MKQYRLLVIFNRTFLILILMFSFNLSFAQRVNVADERNVEKFMMEKTWSCSDAGQYTLNFTYDYMSKLNTYGLIFWTMDKSIPWNFINVSFQPGYKYAKISGMRVDDGSNMVLYLFPDGHCESPTGNYYKLN